MDWLANLMDAQGVCIKRMVIHGSSWHGPKDYMMLETRRFRLEIPTITETNELIYREVVEVAPFIPVPPVMIEVSETTPERYDSERDSLAQWARGVDQLLNEVRHAG